MHIAFITSVSPPLNLVSTKRAYYFAHHLALLGHKTTLISADYRSLNQSLLWNVDETKISHFIRIDPREWFHGFENQTRGFRLEPELGKNALKGKATTFFRLIQGWGPWPNFGKRALRALLNVHRKDKIDTVFAIFGDETSHEVAHRFYKETQVPWIADFKDPWDFGVKGVARQLRYLQINRRLKTACRITETTETQALVDQSVFDRQCFVIPSGFDLDVMNQSEPITSQNPAAINLFYFGSMGGLHDWQQLIVLLKLVDRSPLKGRVRLNWFGSIAEQISTEIEKQNLTSYLQFHSQVPFTKVYGLMKGAQILLLVPMHSKTDQGGGVGIKELEYVAAARPILCLGKIHDQIKKVMEPELLHEFLKPEPALKFLMDFFENPRKYEANLPQGADQTRPIHQYSWHRMAQKLSGLLSNL